MSPALKTFAWIIVGAVGAFCLGGIALHRGEPINSIWLVLGRGLHLPGRLPLLRASSSRRKVMALDDKRATPAERLRNGHDFEPTNKWIVFGHHFAAIAGPGPLVGPVLAAQFGYLPGTLWIIIGAVLGGAVQDFVILFCLDAARRQVAGPDGARGDRQAGRRHGAAHRAADHDHPAGGDRRWWWSTR